MSVPVAARQGGRFSLAGRVPTGIGPLLIVGALTLSPLAAILYGATNPGFVDGTPHFSLSPLADTYGSATLWQSLAVTLALAVVVGTVSTLAGGLFAWLITRTNLPMKGLLEVCVIATLFTSPFIASIAWFSLGAKRSALLNVIASEIAGHDVSIVNLTSLGGVAWVLVLHYLPYVYLFATSALKNVDSSLEEASYVNGYGAFSTFWRVTLRLIFPSLASAFIFVVILSAGVFSVPAVLGRNLSFVPLPVLIFDATTGFAPDYSRAASIATALFVVSIALYVVYRRLTRRERRYVTVSGRGFGGRPVQLGWSRHVAAGGMLLYGIVGTVIPNLALIFIALTPFQIRDFSDVRFTWDNVSRALSDPSVISALYNTLIAVVATTVICCGLALASAFAARRAPKLIQSGLDYFANLPLAIPGIVMGVGLITIYVRTPLYATVGLLVLGFVTHYIPHAFRIIRNGSMQLDGSLEEASFACGVGRLRTAARITTPLLMPAVFSAVVLTVVFTIRELNIAILLYSPNSRVVSVMTWDLISNGSLQTGAVLGILQTIMLVAVLVLARFVFRVRVGRPA